MRRTALVATAAGITLLLTGCGAGDAAVADGTITTPQATPVVSAAATPRPTPTAGKDAQISDLRARMLAVAGVLERSDLPTHTFTADEYTPGPVESDPRYECMYLSTPSYLINHPGTSFTKGLQMIGSSVDVFPTPAAARADLKHYTTSLGQYCLMRDLTEDLKADGLNVTDVKVTSKAARVPGAEEALRVLISFKVYGPNGPVRSQMQALIAAVSGAQVVVFSATGNAAVSALAPVGQLAERAVARVRAAAVAPESDADPAVRNLGSSGPALGV